MSAAAALLGASLQTWALTTCDAVAVDLHAVGVTDTVVHATDTLRWAGDPCRSGPVLRLDIVRGQRVVARLTVRPSLTVWVEGWMAVSPAAPGDAVVAHRGRFALERATTRRVRSVGPWQATARIQTGQPLTDDIVTALPDARRGQAVKLRVTRGGITLLAPGRLLEDGRLGHAVRVRNHATEAAQRGVLVAPALVEIR